MRRTSPVFCILQSAICICLLASAARAQDAWSLLTADLKTESVFLRAVGPDGVRVVAAGTPDERLIPIDRFVEVSRNVGVNTVGPAPLAKGGFDLHLAAGDRINGDPAGVKGERLVWRNPVVGDLEIPLRELAGITRPGGRAAALRRKEDVVVLNNKDTVRGAVAGITAEAIVLQTEAGETPLPFASIESVTFAATPPGVGAKRAAYRVRLDDGSSFVAPGVAVEGAALQVTLAAGAAPRSIDLARVAGIEQVNGPVSWLSSRTPRESVHTPYFGGQPDFPARMNANYRGEPIRFKERTYARGIGVHAHSRLTFDLDGSYAAFRGRYALDPSADRGDVTVRIKLDDRVVHEQANVGPSALCAPVVIDLAGAKTLTLEVDFGAGIHAMDRLNWIEPALLKVAPPAEPATAPTTAPTTRP